MTMGTPPESKFVTVNGLRLHYLDWGGPAERVLLFLHGLTGNAHDCDHIAPALRNDFRIISLDQRGHGDSDHTWEGYGIDKFANDAAVFAETIGIVPYDVVGASLGARVVVPMAGDHSDQIRHAMLLDFGPEGSRESSLNRIGNAAARPPGWRSKDDFISYRQEQNPRADAQALRNAAEHGLRLNYAGRYVPKADRELFWVNGGFGKAEVPYLWDQWAKITCPLIVLHGGDGSFLSPELIDRMRQVQPTMRVAPVPNSGHGITTDNPAFLTTQIRLLLEDPVEARR